MKTVVHLMVGVFITALFIGCAADPTEDKTKAVVKDAVEVTTPTTDDGGEEVAEIVLPEGTKYIIDNSASNINFTGSKFSGTHSGGWGKFEGTVIVPDGDFTKAYIRIDIDMKSTFSDDTDLTAKLVGEEFFEADTYPTSTFIATKIEGSGEEFDVSGNLTLHGITKNLTFPALVELSDNGLIAEAEFSFNRKDFDINYDGLADDAIRDNVLMLFYVEGKVE
jgi:polyisoprenoid-binding protein YceI